MQFDLSKIDLLQRWSPGIFAIVSLKFKSQNNDRKLDKDDNM